MTILVTGFSAFPGAPANPTEELVRSLALDPARPLATAVLPVEWDRSWAVLEAAIGEVRPDAVLMLGLAARAERVRIELAARNRRDPDLADAAGCRPAGDRVADGPDVLPVRLPLDAVWRALRDAGIDFEWSGDAGAYLCNDTLYRLARHAGALGVRRFGFLHMPLSDELVAEWAAASALPERCRTLPAHVLRRAAEAVVGAFAGCDASADS